MYSKIIAVGRLQESAVMYAGDVKDVIVFRLYPDNTPSDEDDVDPRLPLECKYEVYRGDDYLLALNSGTIVFVEGDVFVSESQEPMLECVVKKMCMIVEQKMDYQT
jgi:hypothetical protein